MATDYDGLIAALTTNYATADTNKSDAVIKFWIALDQWIGGNDHAAIGSLIDGCIILAVAMESIISMGFYGWNNMSPALTDALDRNKACPFITESAPADVTMDAILSAMITANFDDFQMFVGIVDGYRAALWNEPFNVDMYAALARGFMR